MAERRTVLFLTRVDDTAIRLAGSCALAAAAMGDRVDGFLFGRAVPAVVAAHGEADGPARLLHQAREGGGCRLLACSQGLVAERVDAAAAEPCLWPCDDYHVAGTDSSHEWIRCRIAQRLARPVLRAACFMGLGGLRLHNWQLGFVLGGCDR